MFNPFIVKKCHVCQKGTIHERISISGDTSIATNNFYILFTDKCQECGTEVEDKYFPSKTHGYYIGEVKI